MSVSAIPLRTTSKSLCHGSPPSLRQKALLGACLALSIIAHSPTAQALDMMTAQEALGRASPLAMKWNPDAALTQASATDVKQNGKSIVWQYLFQSQTSRTCFRVVVIATGATNTTDLGKCTLGVALASPFVDSPVAFKAAVAGGFKPGETNEMSLVQKSDRNLKPARACWVTFTYDHDFDRAQGLIRGWCVDPKTGQFVTRLSGGT